MKILSGPYGTLLEFDELAQRYGLSQGLRNYYQSKRGSFYATLHPKGRKLMNIIAQEYITAGADIILTPTYRGGNYFLRDDEDAMLCHHRSRIIAEDIVKLTKSHQKIVRGSIGPIGDSYTAVGSPHTIGLGYEKHLPMVVALKESGVNAIIFETAIKKEEIYALITLAKEHQVSIVVSFYVTIDGYIPEPNGKQTLGEMIKMIDEKFGGDGYSFGINCASKDAIRNAIKLSHKNELDRISTIYPNASHPTAESYTCHPTLQHDHEDLMAFFSEIKLLVPSLSVIGGCCGYTPKDIQQLTNKRGVE